VTSTSRNMERTENPLVSLLRGVSNVLDRVSIYGIVVIMAAMTAIVFTQVFARYVLNRSIPWGEEISRYMMIWVCFLGSAVAVKRGGHIGITFLRDRIPEKAQVPVGLFVNICVLIFLGYTTYYGFEMAKNVAIQRAPASRISMFWPYSSIPVGCLIMFIHTLANLFERPQEAGIVSNL